MNGSYVKFVRDRLTLPDHVLKTKDTLQDHIRHSTKIRKER